MKAPIELGRDDLDDLVRRNDAGGALRHMGFAVTADDSDEHFMVRSAEWTVDVWPGSARAKAIHKPSGMTISATGDATSASVSYHDWFHELRSKI